MDVHLFGELNLNLNFRKPNPLYIDLHYYSLVANRVVCGKHYPDCTKTLSHGRRGHFDG